MKKRLWFIILSLAGIVSLFLGGFMLTAESFKMAAGLCIGFGSAMLALGIGNLLRSAIVSAAEDEEMKKQKEIEINDERNIRIRERTGYMVSKVMNYMICAVILALGFMHADMLVILIISLLLILQFIFVLFFSSYYSKKM